MEKPLKYGMVTQHVQTGYSPQTNLYYHLVHASPKMFHVKPSKNFKKGDSMDNLTAMEYLSDIMNVYLAYIPVSVHTQFEIKEALSLAIGALKTIHDMETKGE